MSSRRSGPCLSPERSACCFRPSQASSLSTTCLPMGGPSWTSSWANGRVVSYRRGQCAARAGVARWITRKPSQGMGPLCCLAKCSGRKPGAWRAEGVLRPTNGSDAIKLADGFPEDLSPDGRFVVVVNREEAVHKLALVPVGPGQSRRLPADTLVRIG